MGSQRVGAPKQPCRAPASVWQLGDSLGDSAWRGLAIRDPLKSIGMGLTVALVGQIGLLSLEEGPFNP